MECFNDNSSINTMFETVMIGLIMIVVKMIGLTMIAVIMLALIIIVVMTTH